jgi:thiol-disulfide isomerase/thioredoxin
MRGLVIALSLCVATAAADAAPLKVGDRLVELDAAVDAGGKPVKLKSLSGWIVITVGAEWCKPCAKELPTWDRLAADTKGKVTFVAVDVDDDAADGKRFHKKLGLKNMKLTYMPSSSAAAAKYGAQTMPSTFVIDPKGVIKHVKDGFEAGDAGGEMKALRAALTKLGAI